MRSARGIVLLSSSEGRIVEVLHDTWNKAKRETSLLDIVDEADQRKCKAFIQALSGDEPVFGWEMHIKGAPVIFAACQSSGLWLVIGNEEPGLIERLHHELSGINNELTNSLRSAYKQNALTRREAGPSLEDFARLNNEMSALHREITKRARDLERINQQYEQRQAEMKALDERRESFLQHLVHDLRSPLTSVNGAIGLALSGHLGAIDESARETLVLAQEGCVRLTEMISDLLNTAKAEAGSLELASEEVAVADVVEAVARELRNRALESKISLTTHYDEGLIAQGDSAIVRRVLANFVVNALKFSPPEKTVAITATATGDGVRIAVTDEGPGIPEAQRERLFKKYGQIERRGMSTGLGLAFCREMCHAMGGKVGVYNNDSTKQKSGATFWFELRAPAKQA